MTLHLSPQAKRPPNMIDFGVGHPTESILPTAMMAEAAAYSLANYGGQQLQYGDDQGTEGFRAALATFLTNGYGFDVDPSRLMVTAGTSHALDFLCTGLTQPGDTVFVEEPTYFLVNQIFRDHHLNIVGIPLQDDGIDLVALEEKLKEIRPKLLYIIPSFQNPSSISMSEEKRLAVAKLSKAYDFKIIADEVYQLLYFGDPPPPSMAKFSAEGNIVSVGTFSKILGPGTRLGWLQTDDATIQRLLQVGIMQSGGCMNHLTSNIVRAFLELGLQDQYLTELKAIFRHRVDVMDACLQAGLPDYVTYNKPEGGYFFWLKFPEGFDTADLLAPAFSADTGFVAGVRFSANAGLNNYLRLTFSLFDEAKIEKGLGNLTRVIREFGLSGSAI